MSLFLPLRRTPSLPSPPNDQMQNGILKCLLPKKRKTMAFQFSLGGRLSTWPAYASGQAILQNRKPCCSPEGRSNKQASLTIAKPRYLEELESYLRKELQSLDLTNENAQELKLQPYREIFEFFIEDFKTYKPLLSAIKNEYEVTLDHLRQKVRSLESLKGMLVSVSEECTQQIVALQEEEKAEITALKKEKLYLLKQIDKMEEEKGSLQTQSLLANISSHSVCTEHAPAPLRFLPCSSSTLSMVPAATEPGLLTLQLQPCVGLGQGYSTRGPQGKNWQELGTWGLHFRTSGGCNNTRDVTLRTCLQRAGLVVVTLLLTVRRRLLFKDVSGEDVVKLTLALKIARQDLTKAQVELNTMRADYGDVVPRRDYESQEKKYMDLLEKLEVLQKDFEALQKEYSVLLEIHREAVEERDHFFNELQEVQHSSTPRPDWAKCAEVIAGGPERWSILQEGKSSDQMVAVLLEEIGAGVLKEKDTFPALGKGDKVPVYLRYEGQVKNKKLNKKDVVNILREIWKEKVSADQQKGKQSNLPEFFLSYLQKCYGDAAAFDWAYTIHETVKLYRSNEAMSLFYDILSGKVSGPGPVCSPPLSLGLGVQLPAGCTDGGRAQPCSGGGSVHMLRPRPSLCLWGPLSPCSTALRAAFPLKSSEQLQELLDASRPQAGSPEELIDYRALFAEVGAAAPLSASFVYRARGHPLEVPP
nr:translin-associated factor X-interacting protein 1 [Pelodiscus sinensis]|eukprot:XP_025043006.1 translin-associated factor X-interacting protein 1 [Pelodiscus sinensis]